MKYVPVRRYPSDLTDAQWLRLEPCLQPERRRGRHRTVALRAVANAISYRWETGCVWRMLPHDLPYWGTVYGYFSRWQRAGVIRQFREILLERPRTSPKKVSLSRRRPKRADAGFSPPHDRREEHPQAAGAAAPLPDRVPS